MRPTTPNMGCATLALSLSVILAACAGGGLGTGETKPQDARGDDLANLAEVPAVGTRFRDCWECPQMVVVPAGSYRMGSPSEEEGRHADEGPVHEVTFDAPFAVGRYEVTFVEWDACARAGGCLRGEGVAEDYGMGRGRDPVVSVSWNDAKAYVEWLSKKTEKAYRLPSESEWEYAARAGTTTPWYWDEGQSGQCQHANGADASVRGPRRARCYDGYPKAAPVGSFSANGWGLHDMLGNVWEWTQDCWNDSYAGAPADGRAWENGDCARRVLRGGSWFSAPWDLRAANRFKRTSDLRAHIMIGFRVARTLAP